MLRAIGRYLQLISERLNLGLINQNNIIFILNIYKVIVDRIITSRGSHAAVWRRLFYSKDEQPFRAASQKHVFLSKR